MTEVIRCSCGGEMKPSCDPSHLICTSCGEEKWLPTIQEAIDYLAKESEQACRCRDIFCQWCY